MSNGNHLYLIDGSSFIFRAYHAIRPLNRPDGTPVNAVSGFCNMLFKLLRDLDDSERPSHLAVIFDAGKKTFRNDIYPEYKAHRPPAPDDLIPQFKIIHDAVEAFNLPSIQLAGYEADDIIATYAKQAESNGSKVTIVSTDKDLMQLVSDDVRMLDTMKNRHIGIEEVTEKFGLGPEKVIEIQALAGDSADNIPGVPGIGVKTAALLLSEFGDLDTLLARAGEIKQNKRRENLIEFADQAKLSLELVTLALDVPDLPSIDDFALGDIDPDKVLPFLEEQNFRSLQTRILTHLGPDVSAEFAPIEDAAPKEVKYETVTTIEALKRWIKLAENARQITIDTETTSTNAMAADLVGISLSINSGDACYIPLAHVNHSDEPVDLLSESSAEPIPDQIPMQEALELLKPLLKNPAILKIAQNMKYDALVLKKYDVEITPFDDTMLLSYVLDAGVNKHNMDELARVHLDLSTIPFKEIAGTGKKQITFDKVAIDKATEYAAEDADITGRLHRLLKPRLVQEKMVTVYETLERPLVPVLVDMEHNGIKVDKDMLNRLSNEFAVRLSELEGVIHDLAGHAFNIASPKQLGEVLFEEMAIPGGKKSKTGAYTTGADILEKLAADGHELPEKVLEWRALAKLKSTYTDALQNIINKDTGRIHTSYSLAATTTGRLSSTDPNLQNIPIRTEEGRKIRNAFIPEQGYKLVAADYSQIELRLLAHIAELDSLKKAFNDGIDIHAMTASEVFGVPIEGMDPIVRRQAKAINFGIIYGISSFGLANQLGMSRTEAKTFIDKYFERFPGIRHYMEDTKQYCRDKGYVETIFGRKIHIGSINDKNGMRRSFGERAAINAPIQGSAADVIRRAMIQMPDALKQAGLNAKMLLQVHDELVFEVPEEEIEKTTPIITSVMEKAALPALQISVPLTVDCGIGDNWNEAH
ncbi:MAG: DNA polymerase I [Emcibacteraceae bacterium]|jgi:DNA polymerase-1|uniref:DNA polymerase I n=1 Tax=Pseudemcibacter sp. TaxID=2943293 RepID=UPI003F6A25A0|nr:DNA polymerase I [Kordiimonadaceae bacterium]MDG1020130.1 DNA polymerase I [Emcibacteraceae bacterium]MDG1726456.1 DNA polymerase I [Emcibacteraceae bacterium]